VQVLYLIDNDKTFHVDLPYKMPSKLVFWETKYTAGQECHTYEPTLSNFVKKHSDWLLDRIAFRVY